MNNTEIKVGDKVTWMLHGEVEVKGCTVLKVGNRIKIAEPTEWGTVIERWVPAHNLTKEAA